MLHVTWMFETGNIQKTSFLNHAAFIKWLKNKAVRSPVVIEHIELEAGEEDATST